MPNRDAGQVLGGKYRLVARLGGGGMGSVWRAEHLALSSPVAIKLIEPATAREPDALHRFMREARTAAALRSPHVVQIFDYGVDGDTPYIVMELLEGESLAERLARCARLSRADTARVIQHIARALVRAHDAGIVHRDLKPENVFLVKNDDEELAKVLDFGIVKADPNAFDTGNAGAATRTGTLLGTPYFMSPEQAESSKGVDHRADIWALGVLAYRCLLGELPFTGDSVGRLILEICSRPLPVPSQRGPVPAGFDAWFARACARDPANRFESAKRAAAELAALTDAPAAPDVVPAREAAATPIALRTTTLESSNTEVLTSPRRPRRLTLALSACAVLSLGAAIAVRSWSLSRARLGPTRAAMEQRQDAQEASVRMAGNEAASNDVALEGPERTAAADTAAADTAASDRAPRGAAPGSRGAAPGSRGAAPAPEAAPERAAPAVPPAGAPGSSGAPATPSAAAAPRARAQLTRPAERKPAPPPRPRVDLGI
jgi:serine/threonine protein kinase